MLRVSRLSRTALRVPSRCLAMLSPLEEAPMKATLAPSIPALSFEAETLSSGISVACRNTVAPVVSIKFTILGGSSAEEPSQRGAAHLLAVSSLAGTNKRSGLRLTRDLENLGARIVTSADKQKISVTVTALADKIEKAVQGVCEAIIHPPSSAFAILDLKDTAVLAYEAASEPVSVARDLLHEAAFGDESPLGSTFLPSKREFDELSLENVLAYRAKTFVASNVVVTASGVSLATLKALLETHLHELPKGAGKVVPASPYIGGDVKVKADLGGRTVMGLGFPVSGSVGSALLVKDVLIGKHKNVTASLDVYTAGGLLSFVIDGASPQDATATLEAVVADIKHLGSGSPAVEALRKQISLDRVAEFESPSFVNSAVLAVTTGGVSTSAAAVSLLELSGPAVAQAAKSLASSAPSYAVYGRTAGVPSYIAVTKLLK